MRNFTKVFWGAVRALALMWPAQTSASPLGSGQLDDFLPGPWTSCAIALGARVAGVR